MTFNNSFQAFQTQLEKNILASGMTFNPSIDCRNDLVNFYGYTRQQVNVMCDGEVFSIMDKMEDMEKGYSDFESELTLPVHIQDNKCKCGGNLKVSFVDCETRGDCEIYVCECLKCSKPTSFNYAAEWYEEEFYIEEVTPIIEAVKLDTRTLCEVQELSIRSYNCLKKAGYNTVEEVKKASLLDMQKVRNLGMRSLEEIQEVFNIKFI